MLCSSKWHPYPRWLEWILRLRCACRLSTTLAIRRRRIGVTASLIAASKTQRSSSISSSTSTASPATSSSQSSSPTSAGSSRASATPKSSSSTKAPQPSSQTGSTSSSTPNPVKTVYPRHDRAVAIGAGAGTSIALLCLAALGFYIFHRKLQGHHHQRRKSDINAHLYSSDPNPNLGQQGLFGDMRARELSAGQFGYELPGDAAVHELSNA